MADEETDNRPTRSAAPSGTSGQSTLRKVVEGRPIRVDVPRARASLNVTSAPSTLRRVVTGRPIRVV